MIIKIFNFKKGNYRDQVKESWKQVRDQKSMEAIQRMETS